MRDFVRDNQGSFKFLIVSFQSSDFSPYSAMHPVECDCCQTLPIDISFCSTQSF